LNQPIKHNFRELKIWKKSMELAEKLYGVTSEFPKEEQFGLTSQIRRAAVSIPSNIAEGAGRNTKKYFLQFLGIALGSGNELATQIMLSKRLGYINHDVETDLIADINEIQKMNFSFQKMLSSETV